MAVIEATREGAVEATKCNKKLSLIFPTPGYVYTRTVVAQPLAADRWSLLALRPPADADGARRTY
jgi:hypothetical protein